ncbi:hypothetical protein NFI96_012798, partial [Prochilodus magdalenae]
MCLIFYFFEDPCHNYTSLDQPWRATNETGLWICDRDFNWTGWYRLLYYGMNIQMPESCVDSYACGTYYTLWLKDPHPQVQDGIVTCGVCMSSGWACCLHSSTSIRVKACPEDYYVYEFVRPTDCPAAYCAADSPQNLTFDPCNVSSVLDDEWRGIRSEYYTTSFGHDDTLVEWSGWYRLYLRGRSAQLPESDWCATYISCGGYTALLLGGPHPQPQDGIVTRDIYGAYDSQRIFFRSNSIKVKACPGNYFVYRLVKPDLSLPMPTYCAVVFNTLSYDPCNNYTTLDQPWRGTNETGLGICDTDFNWDGWYRLLYNGMNIRMPESCVDESRCGTYYTLWLNGSHPQIEDGIVTRRVCMNVGWRDCCYYRSTPIRIKACPGNYHVYEFVTPTDYPAAYCADVNTITPDTTMSPAFIDVASTINTTDFPTNLTFDPCQNCSGIDIEWRRTGSYYYTSYKGHDDTLVKWSGWYRLYLQGKSAQLLESDWCTSYMTCGGYTPLLLGGSHPRPQDGIITKDIYGSNGFVTDGSKCNSYKSNPIQVKACPGDYYVYRLVKPSVSIPMPTYCAVVFDTLNYDPCNNYTTLDQPWRGTNETGLWICDRFLNWKGWYRMLYNGMNIRMPESCVNESRCGTYNTLWLNGSHPQEKDGIVTRGVCGRSESDCCYYRSTPIRVKACPGDYYVYEFVKPIICDAVYCAAQNFDPCSVYRVLNDDWRQLDNFYWFYEDDFSYYDDTLVEWSGWYRLYLQGNNAQIPESVWCSSYMTCGGYTALLLGGSHPRIKDGIVTRDIYGTYVYSYDSSQCNSYRSNPIQIKACPGNYYVYKLTKPAVSIPVPTYCADQNFTLSAECKQCITIEHDFLFQGNFMQQCIDSLFNHISNSSNPVLPVDVSTIVKQALEVQAREIQTMTSDQNITSANQVLNRTEILMSTLANPQQDNCSLIISVDGLDVQVFAVGPNVSLKEASQPNSNSTPKDIPGLGPNATRKENPQDSVKEAEKEKNNNQILKDNDGVSCLSIGTNASLKENPQLSIKSALMDIDLIQISKDNNGPAAVAFMSYTNLSNVLKPSLFSSTDNSTKTMMSIVISAMLLRTTSSKLKTPVNFTLQHITEKDSNGILYCVYWNEIEWVVDGCTLLWTNSTHSVCSCVHLSTFALIMQINPPTGDDRDPELELIGIIAVTIGLIFLSLALLTFAVCRQNPRVTSIAQINLCINLLLAHLFFLLAQNLLRNQQSQQLACAVMAGVVHYFFLAAFVWMLIEAAVLLFHMKNLTKLRSKKQGGRLWKWLVVIGYAVPLVVVGVSAGVVPHGYDRNSCWLKADVLWSFLGPVSFILAANTVIFICILVIVISTLTNMKSKALKIKRPKSEHRVLTSVALKTTIQFIILGCSWILGFFTQDSRAMEIIFLLLNSQQGTFIFFIYCVFNQEVSHHLLYLLLTTSSDPCSNYTTLDNPWRGTNTTIQLDICDRPFNWTGWYRMLYFGSNIRMPESCVSEYRCGTAITMWMNGLHPQTANGIVSRGICGRQGVTCCAVSYTIRVKACPGNYYVYEFVKPTCTAAYCTDVSTITPRIDPTTATDTAVLLTGGVDPCTDYSVLDEEWRVMYGLLYSIYRGHDDTVAKWSGWYRLYLQGNSAQIPEPDWCASYLTCGGYTPLLLGGAHPLPEDGIVTRDVYGSYGYVIDSKLCNSRRSYPIQVKACPGDYYVYKLVQPTVGFPRPTYCAVALNTPSIDPCNSYTSLDQPWRGTNATGGTNCDLSFNGTDWYRLMYKGMNIRMPETCVASSKCGTATSLWLNGSHPQIENGIVVLRVCGRSGTDCCYYRSTPVRVKACPGNYYVYQLFSTTFCDAAYCAGALTDSDLFTQDTAINMDSADNATLQQAFAGFPTDSGYATTGLTSPGGVYTPCSIISSYGWCRGSVTGSHQQKHCLETFRRMLQENFTTDVFFLLSSTTATSSDPCSNYTALDNPWRGTNTTIQLDICDHWFNWTGWYRMLYFGSNIRMPESCVSEYRCGTAITMWMNGLHPQTADGIVSRGICGRQGVNCCAVSYTIRVKACPGNYYVYEFVKPICSAAYCADVSTITPRIDPTTATDTAVLL